MLDENVTIIGVTISTIIATTEHGDVMGKDDKDDCRPSSSSSNYLL